MPTHPRPADRQSAIQAAIHLIAQQPLILDTETTGLGPLDEVIEIALISLNGDVLLNTLVRPNRQIPVEASRIHGITDEAVAKAPTIIELEPELNRLLAGRTVAVYNAEFDFKLLKQTLSHHRVPITLNWKDWHCIMQLYSRFYGNWNPDYRSYRWQRLDAAARQCGITAPQTHRALDDAQMARSVLLHMADQTVS